LCSDLEIPLGSNERNGGFSVDDRLIKLSDVDGRWMAGLNLTEKKSEQRMSFDGNDEDTIELAV
jgi:hypothetical protein